MTRFTGSIGRLISQLNTQVYELGCIQQRIAIQIARYRPQCTAIGLPVILDLFQYVERAEEAWDATKEGSEKAWDATKEGSEKAWDATKEAVGSDADTE